MYHFRSAHAAASTDAMSTVIDAFEAQTTKHKITNRQRGAPQWRLKPHMDTIKYNAVYFGFSKLTRDRRLPAEVQRKLKGLSLISRHIKIKRM